LLASAVVACRVKAVGSGGTDKMALWHDWHGALCQTDAQTNRPCYIDSYGPQLLQCIAVQPDNTYDDIFGAVTMAQSHCKNSPGSLDECRLSATWLSTLYVLEYVIVMLLLGYWTIYLELLVCIVVAHH